MARTVFLQLRITRWQRSEISLKSKHFNRSPQQALLCGCEIRLLRAQNIRWVWCILQVVSRDRISNEAIRNRCQVSLKARTKLLRLQWFGNIYGKLDQALTGSSLIPYLCMSGLRRWGEQVRRLTLCRFLKTFVTLAFMRCTVITRFRVTRFQGHCCGLFPLRLVACSRYRESPFHTIISIIMVQR